MSWRGFVGSLLFAAAAGFASYPLALLLTPFFGWWGTTGPLFAGWTVLYAAGLFRGTEQRVVVAAALGALALALHVADAGLPSLAVSLGAALALVRSGFAFRGHRPARGLVVELVLGAAALGMLLLFGGGGPAATALAVWGYFLIHSAYPLVGGRADGASESADLDPFDQARRHAERILDGV